MKTRSWIASGLAAVAAIATAATVTTTATAATRPAAAPGPHAYTGQDLQRDLDAIVATGVPGVLAEVRSGAGRGSPRRRRTRLLEFERFSRPELLDIALSHWPYSAPGTGFLGQLGRGADLQHPAHRQRQLLGTRR